MVIFRIGWHNFLPKHSKSMFRLYSFVLTKTFILISLFFILAGCSEKKTEEEYPIIDVLGSVEKYQQAFSSDYFSSIELISLETRDDFLLDVDPFPRILLKDSLIFLRGNGRIYSFNTFGMFLNQIGERGQGPSEYVNSVGLFF